ncbi:MAG: type II toxin-antitoxin system RelE/ParE family toxin [Acidobacteriota bacterium]
MQDPRPVRWTPSAANDLREISRFIRRDNPAAARHISQTLYRAAEGLNVLPARGRQGRTPGTRELVLAGLPYIIVYRVTDAAIHILRIYHGARDWPKQP